jgi:hypothetical protein
MKMTTKSAPLGTLGLPNGDHLVRFHVQEDKVSFELTDASSHELTPPSLRKPTGFVARWGGTARKVDDDKDPWLARINAKHLR